MWQSLIRCLHAYINSGGRYFEYLLWIVTWWTVNLSSYYTGNMYCKCDMTVVSKILHTLSTIEGSLSIKIRNRSFPDVCLYDFFYLLWCEKLALEVYPSILDTIVTRKTELVGWVESKLVFILEFRVEILKQKDVILMVFLWSSSVPSGKGQDNTLKICPLFTDHHTIWHSTVLKVESIVK